jgi:hypothetical protein
MSLNIDFIAIITQFAINIALILALMIYLVYTHPWDSNNK